MKKVGACIVLFLCVTGMHAFAQQDSAVRQIKEVEVITRSAAGQVKEQPFAVEVMDATRIRDRNADLNRLLDAMPGIRVSQTGGMGSSFNYSIHGLSGKAVRVFIDGIPMETFGAGYNIGNFPVNAIDRIEVYKGVTPANLGGDALGGAINIITRKDLRSYLDASYSYGSINTHQAAIAGSWRSAGGFVASLQAGYNYSDNNYKVWGNTVEVADASGRALPGNRKYRRFNDDFSVLQLSATAGFTGKRWADQLIVGIAGSDLDKGIQTGRTMAYVYGDVRFQERFLMPSLKYAKKDLFVKGLQAELFVAANKLRGTTIDTGSRKYNWAGDVIGEVRSEMDGIYAQKSKYTFTDQTTMAVANLGYQLMPQHSLNLNYTLRNTRRTGKDEIGMAEWTLPFSEPQHLHKHIAGFTYEMQTPDERWTNLLFVKYFRYDAVTNRHDYNGGSQKELIRTRASDQKWGLGYGTKWWLTKNTLVKFSVESATRMPDAEELLGNGNNILNAPGLKPEESLNFNGAVSQRITKAAWQLNADAGVFYRNTRNMIWLGEGSHRGSAVYENIAKLRSAGVEFSVVFRHGKWLEISGNGTWQDVRNREKFVSPSGAPNLVYNDKMKNLPSLMANGEIRLNWPGAIRKHEQLSFYINTHYVERFFLRWPSLGDPSTKKVIPEQFVQDAGITYALKDNRCSISFECRNILDRQVYDNYLLQKPGRFNSIKIRYFIKQSPKTL